MISKRSAPVEEEVDWKARFEELQRRQREDVAGWVHDANNLLTGLLGTVDLHSRSTLAPDQREDVERIRYAALDLSNLFEGALVNAQLQAGQIHVAQHPFFIEQAIRGVFCSFEHRAEAKGLQFELNVERDYPLLLIGDALLIKRVVANLLDNAIKYTKNGGVIIRVRYDHNKEVCEILVSDTGIGINPDDQTRIFRIFQQSQQTSTLLSPEGFGIGLFICFELVDRMGGTIALESELEKGSTFTVTLPLPTASNV